MNLYAWDCSIFDERSVTLQRIQRDLGIIMMRDRVHVHMTGADDMGPHYSVDGFAGMDTATFITWAQDAINEGIFGKKRIKQKVIDKYVEAYQSYCWPVNRLNDLSLAPFHTLATEGKVHVDKTHEWHMQEIAKLCEIDDSIMKLTPYKVVDLDDDESVKKVSDWWHDLTESGGEVVNRWTLLAIQIMVS